MGNSKTQKQVDREHHKSANEIARNVPSKQEQERQRREEWDKATKKGK
jgi:hypothetical protein